MSLFNNAIAWANFQMSGGVRRVAWLCGGIAVVLPLMMYGTSQIGADNDPRAVARSLRGWYLILGVIQGGLLTFGMPSRVHGAIKRDRITAKIIESHRLMPVGAGDAIAGYIVGPNLIVGAVVATIFFLGLFVATIAGQDWRGWIVLHVAGAGLGASLCCMVAFLSQWLPRLNPALMLLIFGPLGGSAAIAVVPGLRVMVAPFFRNLPELQHGEVNVAHVVAAASQLAFAAILFVGASRRYRRDDVPALGFAWGLALLALWVGVTLVGILQPERFSVGFYNEDRLATASYVVSTSLAMLLAIGPIASAATARLRWSERKRIDPFYDERAPTPIWIATLGVLAVLGALLWATPSELETSRWLRRTMAVHAIDWRHFALDGGVIAAFGVTVAMLAHAAGRLKLPPAMAIAIWVALTWAIPPVADAISLALEPHASDRFPRPLGAVSPPFALSAIWAGDLNAATAGLIAQAAAIPLLVVVWQLIKRRNRAARPPALPIAIANA